MGRKEQMYKDWEEKFSNCYDREINNACFIAFRDGVNWADEHPNTEDIETVLAYTYKGLGWLAENVEFDMGTMGDRALACTETLQLICNQAIRTLRDPKPKKIKL